jgi:hypothetical protein
MYGFPPEEILAKGDSYDIYLLGTVMFEVITLDKYDPKRRCAFPPTETETARRINTVVEQMLKEVCIGIHLFILFIIYLFIHIVIIYLFYLFIYLFYLFILFIYFIYLFIYFIY